MSLESVSPGRTPGTHRSSFRRPPALISDVNITRVAILDLKHTRSFFSNVSLTMVFEDFPRISIDFPLKVTLGCS